MEERDGMRRRSGSRKPKAGRGDFGFPIPK
jgi:hypothetical protein